VAPQEVTAEGVEQSLFHVASEEKLPLLLGLLKREQWSRILIFLNTKAGVEWLSHKLKGNKLPCEGITGDLPQKTRFSLMARFKGGSVKILVATDVASRGIHVEDISHVINYELPENPESYIHRIGRTARAGKTGKAISFACEDCVFYLEPLETRLGYKLPVVWPQDDWFVADKSPDALPERKVRPERPEYERGRTIEKTEKSERKIRVIQKAGKKIIFSSESGGIFGLAPLRKRQQEEALSADKKEKPGRRRRKRHRPKAAAPSSEVQRDAQVNSGQGGGLDGNGTKTGEN
jgi:ATP-dependent RNA helicase RhlB